MIKLRRNSWILIALVLIFLTPGICAFFFYSNPTWLGGVETNRGVFIKPPVLLSMLPKNDKWRIALYSPQKCDIECMGNLDKLARVRLALGRQLYNVDVCLLLDSKSPDLSEKQTELLQDVGSHVLKFAATSQEHKNIFSDKPAFYIISPENYVVLSYKVTSPPDDIFHDIKQLVKDK